MVGQEKKKCIQQWRGKAVDAGGFSSKLLSKHGAGAVHAAFDESGVQLTTDPEGKGLALRLCSRPEAPGYLVVSNDATEALEVARRFCACKQKSDDPSKCAKKMGGRYEGESEQDDRHAGIGIGSVEMAPSPIDYRQLIEDTE